MALIIVTAPQVRAFSATISPFVRPSRPIPRNVVTRGSPTSNDIMYHLAVYDQARPLNESASLRLTSSCTRPSTH